MNGTAFQGDGSKLEQSDLELLDLVRTGDTNAYAELWQRHREAGLRAARSITNRFDPEDMLQEAFLRVLAAIQSDNGPREAFRPYLYSVLRSISISWAPRNPASDVYDDLVGDLEPCYSFENEYIDRTITGAAFSSLRPEWRMVLWYTEVEGMAAREIAPILGVKPNAVSALAYRAREGLRTAWLQSQINAVSEDPDCSWSIERMGAYNRTALNNRDRVRFERHIISCQKCAALVVEVNHVARNLGIVLLPLFLGPGKTQLMGVADPKIAGASTISPVKHVLQSTGSKALIGAIATVAVACFGVLLAVSINQTVGRQDGPVGAAELVVDPSSVTGPDIPVVGPVGAHLTEVSETIAPVEIPSASPQSRVPRINEVAPVKEREPSPDEPTTGDPSSSVPPASPLPPSGSPVAGVIPAVTPTSTPSPVRTDLPPASVTPTAVATPTLPVEPSTSPSVVVPPILPVEPSTSPSVVVPPILPMEPSPSPTAEIVPPPAVGEVVDNGLYLPTISGAGIPNARLVLAAGSISVAETVVDAAGKWSVVPDARPGDDGTISLTAHQVLNGISSVSSDPIGPIRLQLPTIVSVQVQDRQAQVTFGGPVDATVEARLDGKMTGNIHTMDGGTLVRTISNPAPGDHLLELRFVEPGTMRHGAWVSVVFNVAEPKSS